MQTYAEVTQSILDEYFAMIMLVEIQHKMNCTLDELERKNPEKIVPTMTVHVMHEDIFNSMHQDLARHHRGGKQHMLNMKDIMETITMIQEEHLDIRTITMGISLHGLLRQQISTSLMRGRSMKRSTVCAKAIL